MRGRHFRATLVVGAPLLYIGVFACYDAPIETPTPKTFQSTPVSVPQNPQNKADILFMVDNSPSMSAMQSELQAKFNQFFTVFQDLARNGTYADLQIGVVTSDYGAGNLTSGNCQASPGGQRGHLQQVGAAGAGCQGPSDKFIKYAFDPNGGAPTSNLPAGKDLVQTFTCMASVGSSGCGFEHQLESVYAALENADGFNTGFLRNDALLTLVFVTNEDDSSAPPNVDFFNPDPNKVAIYGAYDTYRQTRFGVACGSPPMLTPYPLSGPIPESMCVAAPNTQTDMIGGEYDISRYIGYFTSPKLRGGIKPDPNDVIMVAIDAPETPFQIVTVNAASGTGAGSQPRYLPCSAVDDRTCLVRLDHSCQNNADPKFFGDPSVRLNAVVRAAKHFAITNICGDDLNAAPDYSSALQALAMLISSHFSPGCIPAPILDLNNPDCSVEDHTFGVDGPPSIRVIPECAASNPSYPCWRVEMKAQCAKLSPQSVGVTIDRGPNGMAPANTTARVECTTVADAPDGGIQ